MLILNRKIGETVVIDQDTYMTILGVKGNQVRLGFDAPTSVTIHRQEIYNKILDELTASLIEDCKMMEPIQ